MTSRVIQERTARPLLARRSDSTAAHKIQPRAVRWKEPRGTQTQHTVAQESACVLCLVSCINTHAHAEHTANCRIIGHFSACESGLVAPFLYAA
jgi:hypothetical protein